MPKSILITGATDGIGLETAKRLAETGHTLLLHGRSAAKLAGAEATVSENLKGGARHTYQADLSQLDQVAALADEIAATHRQLDVIINNAGVFKTPQTETPEGYDVRFMVNTIAPLLLTKRLLPLFPSDGRILNLSSAAQAPVDLDALSGGVSLTDSAAYAQSKLAITMWSADLAHTLGPNGPTVIAVNPGSLLGSKMVKEAFGMTGKDLGIGADILVQLATEPIMAGASGRYFDNDRGAFGDPHPDALDPAKNARLMKAVEGILKDLGF